MFNTSNYACWTVNKGSNKIFGVSKISYGIPQSGFSIHFLCDFESGDSRALRNEKKLWLPIETWCEGFLLPSFQLKINVRAGFRFRFLPVLILEGCGFQPAVRKFLLLSLQFAKISFRQPIIPSSCNLQSESFVQFAKRSPQPTTPLTHSTRQC